MQDIEARKGIPKNPSSQVLGEVRANFLGEFLLKPFFVNRRSELFRKFLGRLRMILCCSKTFWVPEDKNAPILLTSGMWAKEHPISLSTHSNRASTSHIDDRDHRPPKCRVSRQHSRDGNVRGEVRVTFWPLLPQNPSFLCVVPSSCSDLFVRMFV